MFISSNNQLPVTQTAGFQGMPPAQMRQRAPNQAAAARAAMNARPITGQSGVPPSAGQPAPRPVAPGVTRPPAVQTGAAQVTHSQHLKQNIDLLGLVSLRCATVQLVSGRLFCVYCRVSIVHRNMSSDGLK